MPLEVELLLPSCRTYFISLFIILFHNVYLPLYEKVCQKQWDKATPRNKFHDVEDSWSEIDNEWRGGTQCHSRWTSSFPLAEPTLFHSLLSFCFTLLFICHFTRKYTNSNGTKRLLEINFTMLRTHGVRSTMNGGRKRQENEGKRGNCPCQLLTTTIQSSGPFSGRGKERKGRRTEESILTDHRSKRAREGY